MVENDIFFAIKNINMQQQPPLILFSRHFATQQVNQYLRNGRARLDRPSRSRVPFLSTIGKYFLESFRIWKHM